MFIFSKMLMKRSFVSIREPDHNRLDEKDGSAETALKPETRPAAHRIFPPPHKRRRNKTDDTGNWAENGEKRLFGRNV
jgi:hypothetical protein